MNLRLCSAINKNKSTVFLEIPKLHWFPFSYLPQWRIRKLAPSAQPVKMQI